MHYTASLPVSTLSSDVTIKVVNPCLLPTLLISIGLISPSLAQVPEQARAAIDRIVGGKGTYIAGEGAYKIVLPRPEATVVLDYQKLSPNIGLNSWVAFTPSVHHDALLTAQFLLLEDEVDSVLDSALNSGLEVTGLADSSVFGEIRTKTLDVTGIGTYQNLASAYRKGLDEIRRIRADTSRKATRFRAPDLPLESSITSGPLNTALSTNGGSSDGVYRAAIGRRALLNGEPVEGEMGISTWIAIAGTDNSAMAQGEFAATSGELQNLLRALRTRNFKVISVHNHTAGENPQFLFVRFWQQGQPVELARGLRYALDIQREERGANHAE